MPASNGVILWEGPSALDGSPIVVIATGLQRGSRNAKTGRLIQTWILRADVEPHIAVATGADASVCGDCVHRPANGGSCYVKTFQAPLAVFRAYRRGKYPSVNAFEAAKLFEGRMVRLGSYGDPAAAPYAMWRVATSRAKGWTGYTHQWRTADSRFAALCMASADSEADALEAAAAGWRFFRVRTSAQAVRRGLEFVCPASNEAGRKTDCETCGACMGTSAPNKASPVIVAHGATAKRFAA